MSDPSNQEPTTVAPDAAPATPGRSDEKSEAERIAEHDETLVETHKDLAESGTDAATEDDDADGVDD